MPFVSTMHACSFHTPPNPVKNVYNTRNNNAQENPNLENLMKLHQMGVITKEELREKVLAWNPNPAPTVLTPPTPSVTVTVTSPESTPPPRPRKRSADDTGNQQYPLQKKTEKYLRILKK